MTWDTRFRAFLATQTPHGVTCELTTLTPDDLPAGNITIRVTWSSVNYKDALTTVPGGKVAQLRRLVPGIDLAGQVVASTASGIPVGSQVIVTGHGLGVSHYGGWAQYARVPAAWALPLPPGLSARQAMILGTAGLTAGLSIRALEAHGLRPGQGQVLVLGATGGVGSTAVGALAAAGYEVCAVTGKPGARQFLHRIGAAEILPRETLNDGLGRPLAGGRWAGCIDPVGGAGTAYALRTMRYGTAVATSGLTAGAGLHATVMPFILRAVALVGIDSVHASTQARREVWARLATDLRPRGLDDTIAREVTLDAIRPTLDNLLAGRSRGRTIVRLTATTESP